MIPDNNAASLRCVRLCLINPLAFLSVPQDVLTSRETLIFTAEVGVQLLSLCKEQCCTPN